jgi:general secretion pathway protein G
MKRGFTLVEILIVVVILGILAAIVVPQFTQASTEAKMNSLCSNLQSLRSQIELYKVQHNDTPPTAANFSTQMTQTSNISGTASGNKNRVAGTWDYGPYLERIPDNPFNGKNGVSGADTAYGTADANDGWEYNAQTGEIRAGDGGTGHAAL